MNIPEIKNQVVNEVKERNLRYSGEFLFDKENFRGEFDLGVNKLDNTCYWANKFDFKKVNKIKIEMNDLAKNETLVNTRQNIF